MSREDIKCRKGQEPFRFDICEGCSLSEECNQNNLDNRLTKQAIIREGIAKTLYEMDKPFKLAQDWPAGEDLKREPPNNQEATERQNYLMDADYLRSYLHSQGVVIKVDNVMGAPMQRYAVEPLIGDE